MTGDKR